MFSNYFKTALRTLLKDKGYTTLNVLGLTVGITFSLLLLLYVADELSFDRYHEKRERLVRVGAHVKETENEFHWSSTQFTTADALKTDYPNEVEESLRLVGLGDSEFHTGDKHFREARFYFSGEKIFQLFTLPLLEGDANTALTEPNTIVLSKKVAEKYFGPQASYLGKILSNADNENWKVSGVLRDMPAHSHILFDALLSDHAIRKDIAADPNWGQFNGYTYVLLRPGVQAAAFENKIGEMYEKYMASIFKPMNININYVVQPILDIHLHSKMDGEPEPLGSLAYVRILGLTALFLVILACINYVNLTTARATRRAREVGVRKAMGSTRGALAGQFLTESALLALFSGALGLLCAYLLLPAFNTMSGKSLTTAALFQPALMGGLAVILVLAGLVAGSYPALVLSGYKPVAVLKGETIRSGGGLLRQGLVVAQFAVSLLMLIGTGVIYDQLNFLKNKELGFKKDQILVMRPEGATIRRADLIGFRDALRRDPAFASVGSAWFAPGQDAGNKNVVTVESDEGMKEIGFDLMGVDEFLMPTLEMKLAQGRNFDGTPGDTLNSAIVNEALVKKMGWADPIGKRLKWAQAPENPFAKVIGVVKNFHQRSPYNPIEPLILVYRPAARTMHARIAAADAAAAIKSAETAWKKAFPGQEFSYSFLDDEFGRQFAADQKRGVLFSVFSGLSIFIACLGLLGLVAYTTEQRRREIGIRKVLGAGHGQVVGLLARHFIALVLIAGLIAVPAAIWFLKNWLAEFPYKTDLKLITFAGALLGLLLLTMLTVGFHTVKAALANPVKSLRSE
jgi:putative ABC transport system permease protein